MEKLSRSQRRNVIKKRKQLLASTSTSNPEVPERKREREMDTTPSPREDKKKPRLDYSAATGNIKVAVTHKDYPHQKLEDKSMQGLMFQLLVELGKTRPTEGEVGFNGYALRDGALVVNCVDQLSYNWFTACVTRLSKWEEAPLKVCDPKELEAYVRVSMFLPYPIISIKECMNYIGFQNQGLQVSRWKILGNKEHENGIYLVIAIPESHFKIIESKGMRIKHGFHTVVVRLLAAKDETTKKDEGPSKVDDQKRKGVLVEAGAQKEEGVGSGAALLRAGAPGPAGVGAEAPKPQRPSGGGRGAPRAAEGVAVPALSSHATVSGAKTGETRSKPPDDPASN